MSHRGRYCAHRKADRVLPVPVGARIRVWSPFAIAGQPLCCGAVASRKVEVNHSRTGSANATTGLRDATRFPVGRRALTLLVAMVAWVFFRAPDVDTAASIVVKMFAFDSGGLEPELTRSLMDFATDIEVLHDDMVSLPKAR